MTSSEKFRVVIADPPWFYRQGGRGASENHYPPLPIGELCNIPVKDVVADTAVLYLWSTNPMIEEALRLLKAWGFSYKTKFPWLKVKNDGMVQMGMGMWVRGCSEDIIIAVRGKAKPPSQVMLGLLEDAAVLEAQRYEHSQKPDSIHILAEKLPGPYLELFGVRNRPGWEVLGWEVDNMDIRLSLNLLKLKLGVEMNVGNE